MKKYIIFIFTLFFTIYLIGCNNDQGPTYKIVGDPIRLSSIVDVTLDNGTRDYAVIAPYTDTYNIKCTKSSKIVIYNSERVLREGTTEISITLTKDNLYGIRVETNNTKTNFKLHCVPKNNTVTLPYDVATPIDTSSFSTESSDTIPLKDANVNYIKRTGGKYIYSNNPELIPPNCVNKAFIRNENLEGDIFFTFEHANYSSTPIYLGYQLLNEGDSDVFITVTNIGYQAGGTWFGQFAWFDYYNTSFELPEKYLATMNAYANYDYAYQKYNPRIFQPTTYRLPAGEYFYVIGGTSDDAYNNINVDGSADLKLDPNRCANGNVKFIVTGGGVTGTFYAYNDVSCVLENPQQLGYVTGGYSAQYSGIADHAGVIDNYSTWIFNDLTKSGNLPVEFTNTYSNNVSKTNPYTEYVNETHHNTNKSTWMTHLNPQVDNRAVGMDIVEFDWVDKDGLPIKIDNLHADGGGNPANTANWMIEYQDHFTFVNQGDSPRSVTLNMTDGGTLAIMLRNSQTGEVLSTYYSMGQAKLNYSYQLTIPAHSIVQVTLQYLLVACSYGNVMHWVVLN